MSTEHEQPAYQNYPAMPPAQPGPMVGPRAGFNGFAITAFVLGVVGFVGAVLGVIFGIVALVDIRRTRQRGKGLAISGIVLSGAWVVAVVVFVGFAIVHGVQRAASQPSGATASYHLEPGQCFDRDTTSKAASVTVLDCAKPHDAEVFAVEPLTGSTYPGVNAVEEVGHTKCPADSDRWLTPGLNYPDIDVHFLYPQAQSWTSGDRSVKCFYRNVTGAKMTGHAKDTGSPYTADQKRYLAVVEPYNKIINEEEDATGSWTAERDVVARSVPVVQQEIDALKAGPWPANLKPTFDSLIADKQLELGDRQRAAAAADENTMDDALDSADDHDGTDQDRTIRISLHLPPR